MHTTTAEDEEADEDSCDARAKSGVVVSGSTPSREAILKKMVITFAERATEDGADESETAEALASEFVGFANLGLC